MQTSIATALTQRIGTAPMTFVVGQKGEKMDLVSRQAVIDEIGEWIEAFLENGCKESAADACLIQDGIIQLPSVQPERKNGTWIDETFKPWGLVYHPYRCDQCGDHADCTYNYCPNCGADMRGEEE